mgnify:CR=1 FL=1
MTFLLLPDLGFKGKSDWVLKSPLIYNSEMIDMTIAVPTGFVTDLASIPRLFRSLIPVNGSHRAPAIVHDYLYAVGGKFRGVEIKRKDADKIFKEAMKIAGVGWFKRQTMYGAVRGFGWIGFPK